MGDVVDLMVSSLGFAIVAALCLLAGFVVIRWAGGV
jgi:hypothetical protein